MWFSPSIYRHSRESGSDETIEAPKSRKNFSEKQNFFASIFS
ncbi:hypothetical protein MICA_776 [Micavibrio aeruginosavorus ARL-13]|uniref:Uncharacterized protein n=1 Tax=Micavibrio aeruginosavorus (strain ARL-13) TaxID=856793 RepID=G2KQH4_MICAA|nr:hypothetical protein MICA_776 [Micavibrio aeruginosavorus ARL-13]